MSYIVPLLKLLYSFDNYQFIITYYQVPQIRGNLLSKICHGIVTANSGYYALSNTCDFPIKGSDFAKFSLNNGFLTRNKESCAAPINVIANIFDCCSLRLIQRQV